VSRSYHLSKQKQSHDVMSRTLLFSSIVQFSLATAHIIISLLELMVAFATSASAADNYFADPGGNELYVGGFFVYVVNVSGKTSALQCRLTDTYRL
jgi:hypothetical protein